MKESLSDRVKDSISHRMAEGIVHSLEIIQVQKQNREVGSFRRQDLCKPAFEDVPIRQAR